MKIFAFALREYDEKKYLEECAEKYGFEYGYTSDYPSMDNLELARGCEGISIITNPMNKERLDKLKELGVKYIATRSIGYEHIDVEYAYQIGMKVSNVTYSPNSVANYTIMMMLIACRKLPYIMKKGEIQDFTLEGKLGKELSDCTVGVIGTGNIGATVVKHLSSFGCRILMNDVFEKEELKAFGSYTGLDTIYREADIVTLHVPAMESNYHMIGREEFGKMKDGVIFVNAARGSLVDTQAMIEGLESGKIGFAALDTIEHENGVCYLDRMGEPMPNRDRSVLMAFPNVLLTSHMAFYTEEAVSDMVHHSCESLLHFSKGEPNPFEVKH